MQIISTTSIVFIAIIVAGLIAASTKGLNARARIIAVLVSLLVPLLGGLAVVAYVLARRRKTKPRRRVSAGSAGDETNPPRV